MSDGVIPFRPRVTEQPPAPPPAIGLGITRNGVGILALSGAFDMVLNSPYEAIGSTTI